MATRTNTTSILGIAALGLLVGCSTTNSSETMTSSSPAGMAGKGGNGESTGTGGSTLGSGGTSASAGGTTGSGGASAIGGATGSGGDTSGNTGAGGITGSGDSTEPTTGGSGGASSLDAGGSSAGGSSGAQPTDGGSSMGPEAGPQPAAGDYGGVGELKLIPLYYAPTPTPPIVQMDCPDDPTTGFTEYTDSFVVQRPVNLAGKDRFKFENGIYTTWIFPNDKSHNGNATKPRTETRFSDLGSGEHIMSFDVMVEPGTTGTVIHQYKSAGTKGGNIGLYLEANGGTISDRAGTVATGASGKWINIKSYFNVETGLGKIWLNNCMKVTSQKEKNALWYFKFGNYHCDGAPKCQANFKNIHFYQKNSNDKYNVKSPIP